MPIVVEEIIVNRCYQAAAGEVRRVTSMTPNGEVTYVSIDVSGEAEPVADKQTPGQTFAQEAEKEVPCPLERGVANTARVVGRSK